ncbi:MAG: O-antigen polysaccharide polymerase Wzy [Synergistales bacterium]
MYNYFIMAILVFLLIIIFLVVACKSKERAVPLVFISLFYLMPMFLDFFINADANIKTFSNTEIYNQHLFLLATILFYSCSLVGIMLNNKKSKIRSYHHCGRNDMLKIYLLFAFVGIACLVYFVAANQGFIYIIRNIDKRAFLRLNMGYLLTFFDFVIFVIFLLLHDKPKTLAIKIAFLAILIIFVLGNMLMGNRGPIGLLGVGSFLLIGISEGKKRSRLLMVGAMLIILISLTSMYRGETGKNQINNIIIRQNYAFYTNSNLIKYVEENGLWHGLLYKNLLFSFIPRKYYESKPPVDDGVYLNNIIARGKTDPTYPLSKMSLDSKPFNDVGALYVNFGIIGVIVGGLLWGLVLFSAWKYYLRRKDGLSFVIVLLFFVYFHFTVYSLVGVIKNFIILIIVCALSVIINNIRRVLKNAIMIDEKKYLIELVTSPYFVQEVESLRNNDREQ